MEKEKTLRAFQTSFFYLDKITLKKQALAYLSRFSATESQLKAFLKRRIQKRLQQDKNCVLTSPEIRDIINKAEKTISDLTNDLKRLGLLDDVVLAKQKALSLQRTGASATFIRYYLIQRGINSDIISSFFSNSPEKNIFENFSTKQPSLKEQELYAALISAKKRRIGPFRLEKPNISSEETVFKRKNQELAILARKGFQAKTAYLALSLSMKEAEEFIAWFRQTFLLL